MIHKLLQYLQKNTLEYAIISGYMPLFTETSNKGDVDILFKKEDFLKIETILNDFCAIENFQIVQIYHQEVYAKNIFIFDPISTQLLNLDIYGKLHRKHTIFFTEAEIFINKSSYKSVSILTTHQEFLHYLLKKLDKNEITDVVFNYLDSLFVKDKESCEKAINTCFSNLSNIVIKAFETKNKNILIDNTENLKEDIISTTKPSVIYKIQDKWRVLHRIFKPTGIAISFLGPDGSGKSTIIEGLKNKPLPYRKTAYFHLKPILNNNTNDTQATIDPHKYAPYSKLKSYTKLLFFIYQYNFGWLKNVLSLRIKSTLIIFDRYYDDLIVDNKRYRYGGSKTIAKAIRVLIPKPKLYFILTTEAEIIFKRKQEVEYQELENQIENYRALANGKQYHNIDVNKSPNEIVTEVYTILMKKMHDRY